jgi:hypothetical protein
VSLKICPVSKQLPKTPLELYFASDKWLTVCSTGLAQSDLYLKNEVRGLSAFEQHWKPSKGEHFTPKQKERQGSLISAN